MKTTVETQIKMNVLRRGQEKEIIDHKAQLRNDFLELFLRATSIKSSIIIINYRKEEE